MLDNAAIAELLIREAEAASGHREKTLRKVAHAAFMWPEEAADVVRSGRSLGQLEGVGPSIGRRIYRWLENPPLVEPAPLRRGFITLAQALRILAKCPAFKKQLKGDLQMHTQWSDGSGTISEMAVAAINRGYEYIAITDHTAGLKVANGLNESRLAKQGREIVTLNETLRAQRIKFTILRSAEMNLSPHGEGDMPPDASGRGGGCFGFLHPQ